MSIIKILQVGGPWIADLLTPYGHMDLLCGEGIAPHFKVITLIESFFDGTEDHIGTIRRSVFRWPLLWRPIRLAVNDAGRLGLQFMNRITAKQVGMFFADEYSVFTDAIRCNCFR